MTTPWRWAVLLMVTGAFCLWTTVPVESESEQVVEVVIKNFTFLTKQGPLRLGLPTVIQDRERGCRTA